MKVRLRPWVSIACWLCCVAFSAGVGVGSYAQAGIAAGMAGGLISLGVTSLVLIVIVVALSPVARR